MGDHGDDHVDRMNWCLVKGQFSRYLVQKLRDIKGSSFPVRVHSGCQAHKSGSI